MSHRSVYQLFEEVAGARPGEAAYRTKRDGLWVDVSWQETRDAVHRIARGLIALGVHPGDRVGILSETRLEWILCDFATACSGAVTVGIYHSTLAPDCGFILEHSEAVLTFAENTEQLDKILSERERLPGLRTIVVFDGPSDPGRDVLSWEDFLGLAEQADDATRVARGEALETEHLASLVYTSGTTGEPKGAMISHGNLLFVTYSAAQCLILKQGMVCFLFLPLAHVFARLIVYLCLREGVTVAFAESLDKIAENMREVRPHFFPSVPRMYEKVYDKIVSGTEEAGGMKKRLFDWSLEVGRRVSRLQLEREPLPIGLRLRHALGDRLVLSKVRAGLGGRLLYAISGAAPLNRDIAEFFHACGVVILEGIGMTENTSFSNVNRFHHNKLGTVGQAGPGIEQRIAEDGEVLYRGDNTMRGYFKDPEATARTIDADGWLHTGDIGEIDDEGFLKITDRKKDLIVTAGGKNVAPQRVERALRVSRYIGHVAAYGDRRKYLVALVTLDADNVREWAAQQGLGAMELEELAGHPRLRELIRDEIAKGNDRLASYETIKDFHVIPRDFTVESGELTPTMKLRRKIVFEKYAEQLEALYPADPSKRSGHPA